MMDYINIGIMESLESWNRWNHGIAGISGISGITDSVGSVGPHCALKIVALRAKIGSVVPRH